MRAIEARVVAEVRDPLAAVLGWNAVLGDAIVTHPARGRVVERGGRIGGIAVQPWARGLSAVFALVAVLTASSAGLAARVEREPVPGPAVAAKAPGGAKAPGDSAPRTVALGISIWNGRSLAELDSFTASIGGLAPATWSIWSQWGDAATREFPTSIAKGVRDRKAMPIIWWEPVDPGDLTSPTFARLANVAAGDHDTYIRRFARDAKAFKSPVVLRFAHEGNGRSFPWGRDSFDNDAATFVAAWRHVHDIFRQVGAKNVRFLWSVAKQGCDGGCNPYAPFYPGDAYVDYLGFSSFNWGALHDEWIPMAQGFRPVWKKLTEVSTRPIIAIETAANADGGDKAKWILNGYPNVYAEFPSIVAIVYLNVDLRSMGHPDWRLSSPPEALQAYASIAARPEFRGKLPG